MPLLPMKYVLGRGEQGRGWNTLVPCVGTSSQISTFWKTIAQMRPGASAHTLSNLSPLQPLDHTGQGALGALHPLLPRLMLKTLHFRAHGSPSSLHLHSMTFPGPGVCWLHVGFFSLSCGTFSLHKSTLRTVPSSLSFSLNLQRCYLMQEADGHPVCRKETVHDGIQKYSQRKEVTVSRTLPGTTGENPPAFGEKEGRKTTAPSSLLAAGEGQSSLSR